MKLQLNTTHVTANVLMPKNICCQMDTDSAVEKVL